MPKTISLPVLTADFEGGTIEEWHKEPGDAIEVGDVIAEVSTDKAVVELEAEHAGILGKILVPAGDDEVSVNTPIAVLLLDGETSEALEGFDPGADVVADAAPGIPQAAAADVEQVKHVSTDTDKGDRVFASPVAIRIAEQLGIDLATVEGSGPDGRIVLGDVEASAAQQGSAIKPAGAPAEQQTAVELPPPGTYEKMPADKIRSVIARRLGEAKREIPHFYLTIDCELDKLLEARKGLNDSATDGLKVSVNDFLIKACALALRDVPMANTGWADDTLLKFTSVNVAVAVATPKGLITPVVFEADSKDLATISVELKELASRAKEGRLKPEEYKGGGFTLSNLGMYGVREFSAIINPPQSCILAVGVGEKRAVVRDGGLAVATVMSCTLSVDHRAVDGALGAEFLQVVKRYIEEPESLLA
ncbi:MAG: pyruvate dehydrogenase complex dihydrolipoamide acetyltransferase [Gammaproteobacteria bacterium]|nr:pyruvate dehydrogenase complex dihydrolipoamide acetyltransferase [Gammaproteobacteria bacterium]MDH3415007.1 pyruvate dehydrogenase complex dihydrolipoamide acetyltransferase [Gammaproteobacteria bacterium]